MATRSHRFVPRLQALDDRSLPSVTYQLVGTTLIVNGDSGPNSIVITDTGTAAGLSVTSSDGQNFPAGAPVSSVVVTTLEGNDTVEYSLTGTLSTTRLLSVDLGRGADSFTANLNAKTITGTPDSLTNLGISVSGGRGGDTLVLNARGAAVDSNARLSVDFYGQAGKDTIAFNYDLGFLALDNVILTKDQRR